MPSKQPASRGRLAEDGTVLQRSKADARLRNKSSGQMRVDMFLDRSGLLRLFELCHFSFKCFNTGEGFLQGLGEEGH